MMYFMKILIFIAFLSVFCELAYGETDSNPNQRTFHKEKTKIYTDQSLVIKEQKERRQKNTKNLAGSGIKQSFKTESKSGQKSSGGKAALGQKLKAESKSGQKSSEGKAALGQKLKAENKSGQKSSEGKAVSGPELKSKGKNGQKSSGGKAALGQKLKAENKSGQKSSEGKAALGQKLKAENKSGQKSSEGKAALGQKLKAENKSGQKSSVNKVVSGPELKSKGKNGQRSSEGKAALGQKLKAENKSGQKISVNKAVSGPELKSKGKNGQKSSGGKAVSGPELKSKGKNGQKSSEGKAALGQKLKAESKNGQKSSGGKAALGQKLKAENKSGQKSSEGKAALGQKLKAEKGEIKTKPLGLITKKIRKVFEDFLEILDKESIESNEYAKAVRFLEQSLYNEASFETLKLLAEVYEEKKDFKNQINVLNVLSANYSSNPEPFYLLGIAYKNLHLSEQDNKVENKKKSIANINQALSINPKYILAYEALLSLLMVKHSKTEEKIHTKESLSVTIDMLKNLRKNKYYIQLCKAYYDNNFLKQSRKACAISVKKNPKDPISPLILVLSRPNKKETDRRLLSVARKFKESFFVQYKTALHFMDQDPKVAVTYFDSAYALHPENIRLNQIMAHFLFENKEEEKSYKHFLNACRFTEGKFLRDFRRAKSVLRRRQMVELILKFQQGIKQCFLEVKKKKWDKKNKLTGI